MDRAQRIRFDTCRGIGMCKSCPCFASIRTRPASSLDRHGPTPEMVPVPSNARIGCQYFNRPTTTSFFLFFFLLVGGPTVFAHLRATKKQACMFGESCSRPLTDRADHWRLFAIFRWTDLMQYTQLVLDTWRSTRRTDNGRGYRRTQLTTRNYRCHARQNRSLLY